MRGKREIDGGKQGGRIARPDYRGRGGGAHSPHQSSGQVTGHLPRSSSSAGLGSAAGVGG